MPNSGSDIFEDLVLNHIFNIQSYTAPSFYVALSTSVPNDSSLTIDEPVGNNYSRVLHSDWAASTFGTVKNSSTISFPIASGSWGTIVSWALFDAETDGNMLIYGEFEESRVIENIDGSDIETDQLVINLG